MESRQPLSDNLIDELALEGLNVVGQARKEDSYDYDITGYHRVPRHDTPFGHFTTWSPSVLSSRPSLGKHEECALDKPYMVCLGGFVRGRLYSPDQIGQALRDNRVVFTDGPGNGKLESLMVTRKYGLSLVNEVAPWGVRRPITKSQLSRFRTQWEQQVIYMLRWYERLGSLYGVDLVNDPSRMWVVLPGEDVQPLDVFLDALQEDYAEVNADFRDLYGHDLPLGEAPGRSQGLAQRINLWEYIRRRYSEFVRLEMEVLRRHVQGVMVSNLEFDTEVDYRIWGEIFDVPGFNMRTTLFEDEIGYLYWVGYGTRLSADLTHRAPMISVRTNQVAAGPRIVPSREATRYWYGQAVQNGAAGFYLWIQDFQGDRSELNGYCGPCMANPDPSTRPKERWETHLEIARQLGESHVFQPPSAETGVLVSLPSCSSGAWPYVFSAYVELNRARVFVRFISSSELRDYGHPLSGLRLLFVPRSRFEHRSVVRTLLQAVKDGLTLVIADAGCFEFDEFGVENDERFHLLGIQGARPKSGREEIVLDKSGKRFSFHGYGAGFELIPGVNAKRIGRFSTGGAAIVEQTLGRGRVITLGIPMLDLYAAGIRKLQDEERGRYKILRHWHRESGAADHSWVGDVSLENLRDVTGPAPPMVGQMDTSIQFAPGTR